MTGRALLLAAGLLAAAAGPAVADSLYVGCDNGLRCFRAPCPSRDTVDVTTGRRFARTTLDVGGLSAADKARPELRDGLYYGTLAFEGRLGRDARGEPVVIAIRIARAATAREARLCRRRS